MATAMRQHVFLETPELLKRIKASIAKTFVSCDLDEEQETGVLNAMEEIEVPAQEVVIRQGDVGEIFYVVENGFMHYIALGCLSAMPRRIKSR